MQGPESRCSGDCVQPALAQPHIIGVGDCTLKGRCFTSMLLGGSSQAAHSTACLPRALRKGIFLEVRAKLGKPGRIRKSWSSPCQGYGLWKCVYRRCDQPLQGEHSHVRENCSQSSVLMDHALRWPDFKSSTSVCNFDGYQTRPLQRPA